MNIIKYILFLIIFCLLNKEIKTDKNNSIDIFSNLLLIQLNLYINQLKKNYPEEYEKHKEFLNNILNKTNEFNKIEKK